MSAKQPEIRAAAAQRTEKQKQLKETQKTFQQRIQQREKDVQQLREAVESHKRSAQTAVEDSERFFTELISSIEGSRSELIRLIRDQEKAAVNQAEGRLERLEQEINDLRRRDAELEQLSHTQDHIQFLQSFQSLSAPPNSTDVNDNPFSSLFSFDVLRESVHQLRDKLEDSCKEELKKISDRVTSTNIVLWTRNDFLQYSHQLTLDLNTSSGTSAFDCWNSTLFSRSFDLTGSRCPLDIAWAFVSQAQVSTLDPPSMSFAWANMSISWVTQGSRQQSTPSWFPTCLLLGFISHLSHPPSGKISPSSHATQLKETQKTFQQRIQQKEKDVQQLRETVESHKRSAQTAVEDSKRIFTELIRSIKRRCSELIRLIRDQEKAAVSRAEGRLERLEQEINDLRRRDAELEQLSHTQDHIQFLQIFQSLPAPPESTDVNDDPFISLFSFDDLRESVHQLRDKLEDSCKEELKKISDRVTSTNIVPRTRNDFLQSAAQRTEEQKQLKEMQKTFQQRIQQKEKDVQQLREAVESHKRSAQTAVEDSERIFTELIRSIERSRSELIRLIRDQEKAAVSRAEGRLERLEQEINDLRRRDAELEQLSHTQDHIQFLQWVRVGPRWRGFIGTVTQMGVRFRGVIRLMQSKAKLTPLDHKGEAVKAEHCRARSAQTAVEDSERIFTELIRSIEKSHSELIRLIRDQEKAAVSRAEGRLERLEQEINDLRRRDAELEQLSHTQDHIQFLQRSAQTAVEDSEKIFTELIRSIERSRSELIRLIRHQEKAAKAKMWLRCHVFVSLYSCSKMAEARFSQDEFKCLVCLDLLKDPVTIQCGHSYCKSCITDRWDQEDQMRIYSCPQCRQIFSPRPALDRNTTLAELVEKLKKTNISADCYAGAGAVQCDVCTGSEYKAVKSCLVCQESYCQTHFDHHEEFHSRKPHKVIDATGRLQEIICQKHEKYLEMYCITDKQCICELCTEYEHKNHNTVSAAAQRTEKQNHLKEMQKTFQQRIQQREKDLQQLRETVESHKRSAQTPLEDSERIFTELIRSIERRCFELIQLLIPDIRDQEKAAVSRAEGRLERLEQEINDLRRSDAELEQLSHTQDHIHFLQRFQSFLAPPESTDENDDPFSSVASFDDLIESVHQLRNKLQESFKQELKKISDRDSHQLTLDLNTKQLKKKQKTFQQQIQQKEKDVQQLRETVESHKRSAQTPLEDTERQTAGILQSGAQEDLRQSRIHQDEEQPPTIFPSAHSGSEHST
ncbi:hypothetical protein Q8A67_024890 [Cirrhinus molitorella]|uniref:RING-type E3 ubiquitin transferase n=1 Tax=Cirrhinus molitorella TaxID=172907 RepID=A0AA88TCB0_9TELE|nr:hypothetical protein Q8A67_024890 [Cirrhinus molitorella]